LSRAARINAKTAASTAKVIGSVVEPPIQLVSAAPAQAMTGTINQAGWRKGGNGMAAFRWATTPLCGGARDGLDVPEVGSFQGHSPRQSASGIALRSPDLRCGVTAAVGRPRCAM
jgi:hypothetical protein